MPILQVDQTGLICVAVVDLLVLLGMLWTIYWQSCRLAAMRGKLGGPESQQTTEKTPADMSPAFDEKLGAELATTSKPEAHDIGAPPPAHLPYRYISQDQIPWIKTGNSINAAGPASPGDWDFEIIVPSNMPHSPPSLCFRACEGPEDGAIGLKIDRIDDNRAVVRMRLTPGQKERIVKTGPVVNGTIEREVEDVVIPRYIWVHLQE